ncbi:MAG: PA2779 family protein [Gammaproteobacteria bacterium]
MSIRVVRFWAITLMVSIFNLSMGHVASAAVIGTTDAMNSAARAEHLSSVEAVLARADVQAVLEAHGVTTDDAMVRVAALSDDELVALQQEFDQMPAGGISLLAVLGVTFVVLLVLELTGVINIFTNF